MRSRISRNACAAWRTSRAPRGRKSGGTGPALAEGVGGLRQPQDRAGSGCAGTGSRPSAAPPTCPPSTSGRCASWRRRSGPRWAMKRRIAVSSLTRISTCRDWPTVSIQNGRLMLAADLVGQRAVEQGEERLGLGRRAVRRAAGSAATGRSRSRAISMSCAIVVLDAVALVHVDQGGDVAGSGLRQAAGDRLPVTLHEREGDHAFQQHDRRDDDDERAGIESLGHQLGDGATARRPGLRAATAAVRAGLRLPPVRDLERIRVCGSNVRLTALQAPSVGVEDIALAAHRLQVDGIGGVGFDLAAQAVDLHVDGALAAGRIVAAPVRGGRSATRAAARTGAGDRARAR